jgi:RHS repeat-associated protein
LTGVTATVSDRYTFDAFGVLITSSGSTPNNVLYSGGEYDPSIGLYYLRARYLAQTTGRFTSLDSYEGSEIEPVTLHKYVYGGGDPVDHRDLSGRDWDLQSITIAGAVAGAIVGFFSGLNAARTEQGIGRKIDIVLGRIVEYAIYGAFIGLLVGLFIEAILGIVAAAAGTPQGQQSAQRGFDTFKQFKDAMGPAGNQEAWHHIVEQTSGNVARFGARAIHNLANLVRVPYDVHIRISAYYSSIQDFTNGLTVRAWLANQSYVQQWEFGADVARRFGAVP